MIMPTHIVAVGGITEDSIGNILLVKTHRDAWVFPGGQVEEGENLEEALIREIKEESGIDVSVSKLIGIYSNTAGYEGYNGVKYVPTKVMMDFTCVALGGELGVSDETTDSKWVPRDQVLDYIKVPNMVERFKAYLDFDGQINYMAYVTKPEFEISMNRKV